MLKLMIFIGCFFSVLLFASVPTEEGLLRNLNNSNLPGNLITIKANIIKGEGARTDYYKFILGLDGALIGLYQINFSNPQMLANQVQDIKYIPDLIAALRKEKSLDKGLFYGALVMLATNRSSAMEVFLEKNGIAITKNKDIINQEKLDLLKTYRSYLTTYKGKGETNSPLNPADPKEKAKILEVFKSSIYQRAKNISLTKIENEFFWEVDWRNVKGFFTNEDREMRSIIYTAVDASARIDATNYISFNNNNRFPKYMTYKDTSGEQFKITVQSEDIKKSPDFNFHARFEESKKLNAKLLPASDLFQFLF